MAEEKREVAIDADFFKKLTEKDVSGELFLKIMDELNISPVMHEYVYSYELNGNPTARKLKESGIIKIYNYPDYINASNGQAYQSNFERAYDYFNAKKFKGDVYSYHHSEESLGEIRTSLMALYLKIDLFMSDDGDAKSFVTNRLSSRRHKITVYNIYDTLVELHNLENLSIKWSEVKGMAKRVFERAMYKYDAINELWHEE